MSSLSQEGRDTRSGERNGQNDINPAPPWFSRSEGALASVLSGGSGGFHGLLSRDTPRDLQTLLISIRLPGHLVAVLLETAQTVQEIARGVGSRSNDLSHMNSVVFDLEQHAPAACA